MEYATLNNGIKMPMAGIGTFLLTPDEAEASVVSALSCGYRLIDTANAYVSGAFGSLSHMMETYFSGPDEQNVSDELSETLMKSVIKNTRRAVQNPKDYMARSNLLWDATLSENRLIKLGKRCDFTCHLMEHQIGAYTNCNHGKGMAVLHPVYYRHIYRDGLPNLHGLPPTSGRFRKKEEMRKRWQERESMPWRISSRKSGCQPLFGNWG